MRTIKEVLESYRDQLKELYALKSPEPHMQRLDTWIRERIKAKLDEIEPDLNKEDAELNIIRKDLAKDLPQLDEIKKKLAIEEAAEREEKVTAKYSGSYFTKFSALQKFFRDLYPHLVAKVTISGTVYSIPSQYQTPICELVLLMEVHYTTLVSNERIARHHDEKKELEEYKSVNEQRLAELQRDLLIQSTQTQETLRLMTAMVQLLPHDAMSQLKELTIEKVGANQSKVSLNFLEEVFKFDNPDNKYLTNIVPQERSVKRDPLKCAKETTSFPMSRRRAASAFLLVRYLFKLQGRSIEGKPSKRGLDYFQEDKKIKAAGIDMQLNISVAIFFLFMEFRKSWKEIITESNPATNLGSLATKNNLKLLSEKLSKIMGVKDKAVAASISDEGELSGRPHPSPKHIDIGKLSDTPAKGEDEKSAFYNAGKNCFIFFNCSSIYLNPQDPNAKRYQEFREYSLSLYQRSKSDAPGSEKVQDNHDYEKLRSLYKRAP